MTLKSISSCSAKFTWLDSKPFSESEIAIWNCYHLLLWELQAGQMRKWLIQAAVKTVINQILLIAIVAFKAFKRKTQQRKIDKKLRSTQQTCWYAGTKSVYNL